MVMQESAGDVGATQDDTAAQQRREHKALPISPRFTDAAAQYLLITTDTDDDSRCFFMFCKRLSGSCSKSCFRVALPIIAGSLLAGDGTEDTGAAAQVPS